MTPSPHVEGFLEDVVSWAGGRADVRAVVLVGSQARADLPADELSDVDLVLVVEEPAQFLESDEWLAPLGEALLTFVEETAVGGEQERRVLFRSGLEVDFSVVTAGASHLMTSSRDSGAGRSARSVAPTKPVTPGVLRTQEYDSGLSSIRTRMYPGNTLF